MPKRAAVFLDRDGTLIEDVGILDTPRNVRILPDTVEALLLLQKKYALFVVTNQSGIAQGRVTADQVDEVNTHLDEMLSREGIEIHEWYVCPHRREDQCSCIKPKSGFILEAARGYQLDLHASFVIGDHPHDTLTANEYGVFGLYVLTGHGARHLAELPLDKLVFHRILDAAEWIMKHPAGQQSLTNSIQQAAEQIRRGKTVVFPTETVYGLGADAFNAAAVSRIFEIKKRPLDNPLIVHISDPEQVAMLTDSRSKEAEKLMKAFWPGPLTLVFPKKESVPDVVTSGSKTVAVRLPENLIAQELIRTAGTPLAAPSANAFSCTSPTAAKHVQDQLGEEVEGLIDGGSCRVGVESTVLSFTGRGPEILRPGGITAEQIEAVIGPVHTQGSPTSGPAESPGLLPYHYAPKTPLALYAEIPREIADEPDVGIMLMNESEVHFAGPVELLSPRGTLSEVSRNLYAAMHRLDALGLRLIAVQRAPNQGLGRALNNRLKKASAGRAV